MANIFGKRFTLQDFGESHGKAIGGIIDGCPPNVAIDFDFIQSELSRRAPSNASHSTQRKESDKVEFLSGIYQNKTIGTPIGFIIRNEDIKIDAQQSTIIKPSHASYVYKEKYACEDNYAAGRASARLTACRVVAGAIAKLLLRPLHLEFETVVLETGTPTQPGDTVGAKVGCTIRNLPAGLGEPLHDKFDARLAAAMLSLNAAKGFEIGDGYAASKMSGLEYNDRQDKNFNFLSNHDGGVQAGITNGNELYFTVAFKPIPSLQIPQETIDFKGNSIIYEANNRNDYSVVPRVIPVIEATAAMVIADFILLHHNLYQYYAKQPIGKKCK